MCCCMVDAEERAAYKSGAQLVGVLLLIVAAGALVFRSESPEACGSTRHVVLRPSADGPSSLLAARR